MMAITGSERAAAAFAAVTRVVSSPRSTAAASSWRARSAASSLQTWSNSSVVRGSVPVLIARQQSRLINLISEAKCPVVRA